MASRTIIKKEIAAMIYLIRGKRVMLDSDLASLYGVETYQINRAVKRNPLRFPSDFYFQLSIQEVTDLRRQIGGANLNIGMKIGARSFLSEISSANGFQLMTFWEN